MTVHRIEVNVSGYNENKKIALAGLLEEMEYNDVRTALDMLPIEALTKVAKCTHGIMYKTLQEM